MKDSDNFYRLLEPVHAKAEAFSRRLTGNKTDGDDLYQDSLLRAFENINRLKDERAFKSWLFSIIINLFKTRQKRAWWKRYLPLTDVSADSLSSDPSGRYNARRWLERAFESLSAEDKALVILAELEGWKISELADLLSMPQGTIKARLSRSKSKMRKKLAADFSHKEVKELSGENICVAVKQNKN